MVRPTLRALVVPAFLGSMLLSCAPPPADLVDPDPTPSKSGEASPAPAAKGAGGEAASPADADLAPSSGTGDGKMDLYFSTLGKKTDQAVIFLHGGPGANDFGFEQTAAQAIADQGFFVVTYDQRGSGRSPKGSSADYCYRRSTQDLADLIQTVGVKSPILIGHSFGGSITLNFLELHPGVAKGTILIGSPINFPDTYFTILERAAAFYNRFFILPKAWEMDDLRQKMFPNGPVPPFTYGPEDIGVVGQSMTMTGLVLPSSPTLEAVKLTAQLAIADHVLANDVQTDVGNGYQDNDHVGYLDFTPLLVKFKDRVFAVYGAEDTIHSDRQLRSIASSIAPQHFAMLPGAGHFPFIDQNAAFVDAVVRDLTAMTSLR